ncbi:MAG: selenocysteine-specific translation elongation factor [Anaerolineae bacterium]|nr:selenocysteine-specific translation elongation factor [Anaerolineae bacterium]MDW8173250.1 selenocysteine-specific translation elongation factor [Anaerolineae bacterium]
MRVIGTAGHVDHGKSTLVKRLTGIDPDRLAEEKARQMTIDLGFAWLSLPNGETVGIIDVPGHRDFIENMLAGVGGIDLALLVIAADEGIMPQTREHLAILDLLGIHDGLIVLSKVDLVDDPDWLELVEADVRAVLVRTALAHAPILRVSAFNGQGINALIEQMTARLNQLPPRPNFHQPRLPIDRVFSVDGFGTVVTGTLSGGTLQVGDEVEVQPRCLRARVRGLQSYRQIVQIALPGSRVAVNLAGLEKSDLTRGDVITYPGQLPTTTRIDVLLRALHDLSSPIRHNMAVKFFSGALEAHARLRLLDCDTLVEGGRAWGQLEFDEPLPLGRGDRFILRRPSPAETLGGGQIVNPSPAKRWRRYQPQVIADLELLFVGTPAERLAQITNAPTPLKRPDLQRSSGYAAADLEAALQEALERGLVVQLSDDTYWAASAYQTALDKLSATVRVFHRAEPLRLGIPREQLRSHLGLKPALFNLLVSSHPGLRAEGALIRLHDHAIHFNDEQQARVNALMSQMSANPYSPPSLSDANALAGEDVVRALMEIGEIIQVSDDVIFSRAAYESQVQRILELIDQRGKVDAKQLRDHFNSSRKYVISLLEYLDSRGVTRRIGDDRVRGPRAP